MKTTAFFGLLASLLISASASAGRMTVSECVADRNPFSQDRCRQTAVKNCSAKLGSDAVASTTAGLEMSARLDRMYALQGHGHYVTMRYSLDFGGMNRGMAIVRDDLKGKRRLQTLEIYVNHDSSGSTYTRYRCVN